MFPFRVTTFVVAMLVMVTFDSTFAQARPIRGLHRHRLLLSRQKRNLTQNADLARRHLVDFTSDIPQQQVARVRVVRRASNDDHGDVSAHDNYESQLHALEAALEHYNEYGDNESLQKYLKGFTGGDDAGSSVKVSGGKSDGGDSTQAPAQDSQVAQKAPAQQGGGGKDQPQPKQNAEDCDDTADQHGGGQDSQDKQQDQYQQQQPSQQTPKKMQKVPKKKQSSTDYASPSNTSQSQPQLPQPQPEQPKSSQPDNKQQSSSGNSINGYTPPAFTTSASPPSTDSRYTGHATFYNTGLGACGIVNHDHEPIVAVSSDIFEQYNPSSGNPNHNSLCGKKVEISWKGKTVHAFATDECPGCKPQSLDCSPSVFQGLDDPDVGNLDGISWRFV